MSAEAGQFVITVLNAATMAHILHFQSKSYAQHMALGGLYEALPGLIDGVVEAYQGKHGIIEEYPKASFYLYTDPLEFIKDLSDDIKDMRDFCEDSEIQNLIDGIADQIDSTMYKLKFLK